MQIRKGKGGGGGKVGHPSFLPSPFRCRAVDENVGDRNAAQTGIIVGLYKKETAPDP